MYHARYLETGSDGWYAGNHVGPCEECTILSQQLQVLAAGSNHFDVIPRQPVNVASGT